MVNKFNPDPKTEEVKAIIKKAEDKANDILSKKGYISGTEINKILSEELGIRRTEEVINFYEPIKQEHILE